MVDINEAESSANAGITYTAMVSMSSMTSTTLPKVGLHAKNIISAHHPLRSSVGYNPDINPT